MANLYHNTQWSNDYTNTTDYEYLPDALNTRTHVYRQTVALAIGAFLALGAFTFAVYIAFDISFVITLSALIAFFYLALMVFKLVVVYQAIDRPFLDFSPDAIAALRDDDLPVYTILIPLYNEAAVIPQIVRAMSAIDYPAHKLDIIITLEVYDRATIDAIKAARPPAHFKTLLLPDVKPKTKPKALNVAFPHTRGELLVIYDAEIVPEPDQLKKAVLAFRARADVACLQTRLDHYNADQNVIAKLFNAEFSFYYDLFLPGLQQLGLPMPLSGHSTHFRRAAVEAAGAWDPYNVTEDCDLGLRMYRLGMKTEILNSVSKEEATSAPGAWVRQRSRWMKGFIQTSIVHLRHPLQLKRDFGSWKSFFAFLLTVPGTVVLNILNVFYWVLLVGWILTYSPAIQRLFPGPIFFTSIMTFVLGNIIFTYLNLIGSLGRKRYALVKYSLLSPVYWILLAWATFRGAFQLVTKPHHWEKTVHGTHITERAREAEGTLAPDTQTA